MKTSEMTEKSGNNLGKKIMNFVLDKLIKIGIISIFAWIQGLITLCLNDENTILMIGFLSRL